MPHSFCLWNVPRTYVTPHQFGIHNETQLGMAIFGASPLWWDRDTDDETGRPIRPDVREAGQRVWSSVCLKAQHILGDASEAPELLERAVKTISRYLDKHQAAPYSSDPAGLLVLAFQRSLHRLASRRNRTTLVGDSSKMAEMLRASDWREETDRRLFLEELARELSNESRLILRLRIIGYDWKQIGRMLGTKPPVLRQRFWRDLRRAHVTLLRSTKLKSFED